MSSYNLTSKGENVRIGNWFEELRLKQDTGVRFYPSQKDKKGSLLTQSRCISHTEHVDPRDYSSNTRDTIIDPRKHSDFKNQNTLKLGPRAQRLEESIRRDIDTEYRTRDSLAFIETRKTNYSTTNKDCFEIPSFTPSLVENSSTLRIPTKTSNYSTEPAVTFYSHAVNNSSANVSFPATFVGSTNPFKKSSAFSADIRRENITKRTESNERPKPLPTLIEFRCLNDFRNRLIQAAQIVVGNIRKGQTSGRSIRYITDKLWNIETNSEVVTLESLQNCLTQCFNGLLLSSAEKNAIFSAYDTRSDGNISVPELINLIRRTPSPRRLELIDTFFTILDPSATGVIHIDNLPHHRNEILNVFMDIFNVNLAGGSDNDMSVTVEEFFDFHIDLSAEVVDDELFESFLIETWRAN